MINTSWPRNRTCHHHWAGEGVCNRLVFLRRAMINVPPWIIRSQTSVKGCCKLGCWNKQIFFKRMAWIEFDTEHKAQFLGILVFLLEAWLVNKGNRCSLIDFVHFHILPSWIGDRSMRNTILHCGRCLSLFSVIEFCY